MFSVLDIASDFILFFEYRRGSETNTSIDIPNKILGNDLAVSCSTVSEEKISCIKYDYWFSILTLLFIYLPSVNVIATLYGTRTAGIVGFSWGLGMAMVGGLLALVGYFVQIPAAAKIGWFLLTLNCGIMGTGVYNFFSSVKVDLSPTKYHFIFFMPLIIFSPFIFIIIKLFAIFKATNRFVQSQSGYGTRGEAILEAAPQLGLQLYIVMLSLDPTLNQILSIITSAATLSLPNIENYISARGGDFGFKTIIKNIPVFLPASLFKVFSVSILCVFLKGWTILIIVVIILMLLGCMRITSHCYSLSDDDADTQQGWESLLFSWLTITSLGWSKDAAVYRLVSTIIVTIIYSLILTIILVICNVDASVHIHTAGGGLNWYSREIVRQPFYLNLFISSTIGLGLTSLVLDIIITWCKFHHWRSHNWGPLKSIVEWFVDDEDDKAGFWDGAVLLQGIQYKRRKKWLKKWLTSRKKEIQCCNSINLL